MKETTMRVWLGLILSGLLSLPAAAQTGGWKPELVSGKEVTDTLPKPHTPPRPDPLAGPQIGLKPKERWGVEVGKRWADNPDFPARGEDGGITFLFGSTLPVVVCAPLYVCDLSLQAGEVVNDLHLGDTVRWQVLPATQGSGTTAITHVIIKPTDVGLITNLVITTDRRAYTIKLVSRREDWMPRVTFFYPDAVETQWSAYRAQQAKLREAIPSSEIDPGTANLDFAYEISGDNPSWRPVKVFANGAKTYIQFPHGVAHGDLPALVALADDGGLFTEPSKQLVNYRYVNGRFEVDKVLERAALISGVGWDQVSVRITRQERR
jgi:type IV secretion system protein TrbG